MNPISWIANLFGPIGQRTLRIIAVAGALLVFIRPVFLGDVPGLEMLAVPAVAQAITWILGLLGALGLYTFVDKFKPERNAAIFGSGTREITPTLLPVVDVAPVSKSDHYAPKLKEGEKQ